MKTIKRTIFVDSLEEIDFENIGCHFTSDLGYSHSGGGSNGGTNTDRNFKVVFYAKEYETNDEATLISNNNYPSESEVVLEMNQEMEVEMHVSKKVDGGFGRPSRSSVVVNTGNRADVWVKAL